MDNTESRERALKLMSELGYSEDMVKTFVPNDVGPQTTKAGKVILVAKDPRFDEWQWELLYDQALPLSCVRSFPYSYVDMGNDVAMPDRRRYYDEGDSRALCVILRKQTSDNVIYKMDELTIHEEDVLGWLYVFDLVMTGA